MALISLIIITILIIAITYFIFLRKTNKGVGFEERLYKMVGFEPYKAYKVEFRKTIKRPDGIYFQYNNGCVLYSLINIGYLDEVHIPSSLKY